MIGTKGNRKVLFIYTAATVGYSYALEAQARRVVANLAALNTVQDFDVVVCLVRGEEEDSYVSDAVNVYSMSKSVTQVLEVPVCVKQGKENYKVDAQLLIAQMRTAALLRAQACGADFCWSLDSDVLPPVNALRCMFDMLRFDNGFYQVAFCPYPSQGGGSFLGGRGNRREPILPDVYEDEKTVPDELLAKRTAIKEKLKADEECASAHAKDKTLPAPLPMKEVRKLMEELHEVEKEIRALPGEGNVFHNNAKSWRQRGWFDYAYPALGRGSIVPTDWTGMGCLLMNKEALNRCDWLGYDGRGTEDLFVNYYQWEGLRMCLIAHCPCDHVIRHPHNKGEAIHIHTYHESGGECDGHMRQRTLPWYAHTAGEQSRTENDGCLFPPEK